MPPIPFSASYHLKANPGVKSRAVICTVPEGHRLVIDEMVIAWPTNTYGELKVRLLQGEMPVIPSTGWATGDNAVVRYTGYGEYGSGAKVQVAFENTSTTDVHECFIVIRGVLEG